MKRPGEDRAALEITKIPCDRIQALMAEASASELDEELHGVVRRHVSGCLDCGREFAKWNASREALLSLAEGGASDPGFDDVFFEDLHRGIISGLLHRAQLSRDLALLEERGHGLRRKDLLAWPLAALSYLHQRRRTLQRAGVIAASLLIGLILGRLTETERIDLQPGSSLPADLSLEAGGGSLPLARSASADASQTLDERLTRELRAAFERIQELPSPRVKNPILFASDQGVDPALARAPNGIDF